MSSIYVAAALFGLLYVIGIPLLIIVVIVRHRAELSEMALEEHGHHYDHEAGHVRGHVDDSAGGDDDDDDSVVYTQHSDADKTAKRYRGDSTPGSQQHADDDDDDDAAATTGAAARLGLKFLYECYRPSFYWFEAVWTLRRLALSIASSVLAVGSAERNAAVQALLVVALVVHVQWQPFINPIDNRLETASLVVLIVSFATATTGTVAEWLRYAVAIGNLILVAIFVGYLVFSTYGDKLAASWRWLYNRCTTKHENAPRDELESLTNSTTTSSSSSSRVGRRTINE